MNSYPYTYGYPYTSNLITKEQLLKIFEKLKNEKIKKNKSNFQTTNKIHFTLHWNHYEKIS